MIKLEENYRSTNRILDAANNVIANNVGRRGKTLFSRKGEGDFVRAAFCSKGQGQLQIGLVFGPWMFDKATAVRDQRQPGFL